MSSTDTNPNLVYTLKTKLDGFQIYWRQEVEDFAKVFFKPQERQREADKRLLHKCIDPAVGRFQGEPEERQVDFRHRLGTFLRLYAFISQLVNYGDPDLEKLYAFGRLLLTKLKIDDGNGPLIIDDNVKLSYYRLTKTHEGSASLAAGETATVTGPTDVGTGRPEGGGQGGTYPRSSMCSTSALPPTSRRRINSSSIKSSVI